MKIYEITDRNKVWQELTGIDLNFDNEYNLTINVCNVLIQSKRKMSFHIGITHIEDFKKRAYAFLNSKPFEPNDIDIINLKKYVQQMIENLDNLLIKLH